MVVATTRATRLESIALAMRRQPLCLVLTELRWPVVQPVTRTYRDNRQILLIALGDQHPFEPVTVWPRPCHSLRALSAFEVTVP